MRPSPPETCAGRQSRWEQVRREHADRLGLLVRTGQAALFAVEEFLVLGVPVHPPPATPGGFLAHLAIREVVADERGTRRPLQLLDRVVCRALRPARGEPPQALLGLRRYPDAGRWCTSRSGRTAGRSGPRDRLVSAPVYLNGLYAGHSSDQQKLSLLANPAALTEDGESQNSPRCKIPHAFHFWPSLRGRLDVLALDRS